MSMEEVGYVMSGCTQRLVPFVVKEDREVYVNMYYFIPHPTASRTDESGRYVNLTPVLTRVFSVTPYNPEMSRGQTGPIAGKMGERAQYGKRLEYKVAWAEVLGYYTRDGKWFGLECAPGTWDPVFEGTEEEIARFFGVVQSSPRGDSLFVRVGSHRGLRVPVHIDLNAIARGHLFVAGMTRSGKSTFVLNLVRRAAQLDPCPHFIVLDRRSEYVGLKKVGGVVTPYWNFLPRSEVLRGEVVASRLGFDVRTSTGKAICDAVSELATEGIELSSRSLMEKLAEVSTYTISRGRERVLKSVEWAVKVKGAFLDEVYQALDVVNVVVENPLLIVDFSVDTRAGDQQIAARHIIRRVVEHAMRRREAGDFSVIVVVEEAQYFAPEHGLNIEVGAPERIGVDKALVEAVSQAGGYNVGFIISTQRPAYIQKSIVSQCNSVVCFRLMAGNDQEAILDYTEYGGSHLRDYLPGLATHQALVWGAALPTPFPVVAEMEVEEFPQKTGSSARQAWERMKKTVAGVPA